MSDPKNPDSSQPQEQEKSAEAMTAAQAAKQVKRVVIKLDEDGKPAEKRVAVSANEVLSFRDYVTHVVVVTTDGQKLSSAA